MCRVSSDFIHKIHLLAAAAEEEAVVETEEVCVSALEVDHSHDIGWVWIGTNKFGAKRDI